MASHEDIGRMVVHFYELDPRHWGDHLPIRLVVLIREHIAERDAPREEVT